MTYIWKEIKNPSMHGELWPRQGLWSKFFAFVQLLWPWPLSKGSGSWPQHIVSSRWKKYAMVFQNPSMYGEVMALKRSFNETFYIWQVTVTLTFELGMSHTISSRRTNMPRYLKILPWKEKLWPEQDLLSKIFTTYTPLWP